MILHDPFGRKVKLKKSHPPTGNAIAWNAGGRIADTTIATGRRLYKLGQSISGYLPQLPISISANVQELTDEQKQEIEKLRNETIQNIEQSSYM